MAIRNKMKTTGSALLGGGAAGLVARKMFKGEKSSLNIGLLAAAGYFLTQSRSTQEIGYGALGAAGSMLADKFDGEEKVAGHMGEIAYNPYAHMGELMPAYGTESMGAGAGVAFETEDVPGLDDELSGVEYDPDMVAGAELEYDPDMVAGIEYDPDMVAGMDDDELGAEYDDYDELGAEDLDDPFDL